MSFPVAILFLFTKRGKKIEVDEPKYLQLTQPPNQPHSFDACESYVIEANIECLPEVKALKDGEYECLLAGTWQWMLTGTDWESGIDDYKVLIEHKFIEIQPYVDTDPDLIAGVESFGER